MMNVTALEAALTELPLYEYFHFTTDELILGQDALAICLLGGGLRIPGGRILLADDGLDHHITLLLGVQGILQFSAFSAEIHIVRQLAAAKFTKHKDPPLRVTP